MKTTNTLVALALTLTTTLAFAQGGSSSHGGDVVACFQNSQIVTTILERIRTNRETKQNIDPLREDGLAALKSVKLYDFNLIRTSEPNPLTELIEDTRPYTEILSDIETNVKDTNYLAWKEQFSVGKSKMPLPWNGLKNGVVELNDEKDQEQLEPNCLRLQIANQFHVGDKVFVNYDARLFGLLSEMDKAGLITHEWNYYPLIKNGDQDSLRARLVTSIYFRKHFRPENAEYYAKELSEILVFKYYRMACLRSDECLFQASSPGAFVYNDPLNHPTFALNRKKAGFRSRAPGLPATLSLYSFDQPREFDDIQVSSVEIKNDKIFSGSVHPNSFPAGVDPRSSAKFHTDGSMNITRYVFSILHPSTIDGVQVEPYGVPERVVNPVLVELNRGGQILSMKNPARIRDKNQTVECLNAPQFHRTDSGARIKECILGSIQNMEYKDFYLQLQNLAWNGSVYLDKSGKIDLNLSQQAIVYSPMLGYYGPLKMKVQGAVFASCGEFCLRLKSAPLEQPMNMYVRVKGPKHNLIFVVTTNELGFEKKSDGTDFISWMRVSHSNGERAQCGDIDQSGGGVATIRAGSIIRFHENGATQQIDFSGSGNYCGVRLKNVVDFDTHGVPIRY